MPPNGEIPLWQPGAALEPGWMTNSELEIDEKSKNTKLNLLLIVLVGHLLGSEPLPGQYMNTPLVATHFHKVATFDFAEVGTTYFGSYLNNGGDSVYTALLRIQK